MRGAVILASAGSMGREQMEVVIINPDRTRARSDQIESTRMVQSKKWLS